MAQLQPTTHHKDNAEKATHRTPKKKLADRAAKKQGSTNE